MQTSNRFLPVGSLSERMGASDEWRGEAMVMQGRRMAILAGNIANVDTPGYRARDIGFADAMQQALARESAPKLDARSAQHLPLTPVSPGQSTLELASYAQPDQPRLDGNTVDMDRQRAGFAQSAILYELAKLVYEDEFNEFKGAASDPLKAPR